MKKYIIASWLFLTCIIKINAQGIWYSPDWDSFNIENITTSCSNPATLRVNFNPYWHWCCTGCYEIHAFKAKVELYYSTTGLGGSFSVVQTKYTGPSDVTTYYNYIDFSVSTAGYYQALVWPETKIISGPCGAIGWTVTGTSSFTNNVVFYEKSKPTSSFKINGEVPADGCTSSAVDVYTCASITLNNNSTGYPTEYRVGRTKNTANCGSAIGATNYSGWTTGSPSSIDLNTVFPGFFTNSANAGWYKIKLEVRNTCGTNSSEMCMKLNTITAVSANFNFINVDASGGGYPVTPATTCASATSICEENPQIDPGISTGTINSYWLKVEEYTTACTYNKLNADGSDNPTPICSLAELSVISLPTYVYSNWEMGGTANNDYFEDNPDKRFKVTLTVSNQCGQSSKTGWFRNNNTLCREANFEIVQNVEIFPNPANNTAFIVFDLMNTSKISLSIIDVTGKEINILNSDEVYRPGQSHNQEIDLSILPSGLYVCKLVADKEYFTTFIKQ